MFGLELGIHLVEKGWMPDWVTRMGIRRLLQARIDEESTGSEESDREKLLRLVEELRCSPIAVHPDKANEQHYEVPPEFFRMVLGPRLKYSSCFWPEGVTSLAQAEEAMLELSCRRAGLEDGQDVLELGCGWGSMTLWMAEHYPNSRILAMSNSGPQRSFIEERARLEGFRNVEVVTCDINDFETERRFDRVVSIEMFEHVRNYAALLKRIARWLRPGGRLFVHIFCHERLAYPYETEGPANWIGRYFFTGGLMPSSDLLLHFQDDLQLEEQWKVNGIHYAKTARAWLRAMDLERSEIERVLSVPYGTDVSRWRLRWRIFFLSCEELFGFHGGREWCVGHYRFAPRVRTSS